MRVHTRWCEVFFGGAGASDETAYEWAEYINVNELNESVLTYKDDLDEVVDDGYILPY